MDPLLNNTHEEFREKVRGFAEKHIKPLAADLDEQATFSFDLTEKMFDEGYSSKPIDSKMMWRAADMATKIELARNLLYKACWLKDMGQSFGKEAAMVKLYTSEILRMVISRYIGIR